MHTVSITWLRTLLPYNTHSFGEPPLSGLFSSSSQVSYLPHVLIILAWSRTYFSLNVMDFVKMKTSVSLCFLCTRLFFLFYQNACLWMHWLVVKDENTDVGRAHQPHKCWCLCLSYHLGCCLYIVVLLPSQRSFTWKYVFKIKLWYCSNCWNYTKVAIP